MINELSISMALLVTGFALVLVYWPLRKSRISWLLAPLLLSTAGLGYWYWGSWQAQAEFTNRNARQQMAEAWLPRIKSPEVLIEKLQKHLASNPRSARGWYLLGRLYASQHSWKKAHDAFSKAYTLQSDDELIAVNYAQSLFMRQNLNDDELARSILKNALAEHPQQADALLFLAMDAQRRHVIQEALIYWRRLLLLVPESSPEAAKIREAINELRQDL